MLEVYRDGTFDLLGVTKPTVTKPTVGGSSNKDNSVQVKLNQNNGINEVTVENGTVCSVDSASALMDVINQGMRNRVVASTKVHTCTPVALTR